MRQAVQQHMMLHSPSTHFLWQPHPLQAQLSPDLMLLAGAVNTPAWQYTDVTYCVEVISEAKTSESTQSVVVLKQEACEKWTQGKQFDSNQILGKGKTQVHHWFCYGNFHMGTGIEYSSMKIKLIK